MGTDEVADKLRVRVRDYVASVQNIVIDPNEPAALLRGPVVSGVFKTINVDSMLDLNELPYISERMRAFAFRYATEYRSMSQWAKEYNVTVQSIRKWLAKPGVQAYIAAARMEQRAFAMARRVSLENKVYQRLSEFLTVKITGDNAAALARALEFAWRVLHNPEDMSAWEKHDFNVNIGINASGGGGDPSPTTNPHAMRNVTPLNPRQLTDIERRLEQIKLVSGMGSEDGD